MKKTLILIILLGFISKVLPQEISEKQRLQATIDTTKNFKKKVQLFADLSWEYLMEQNDSALVYAEKAMQLSKQQNYPLGEVIALETKGLFYEIAKGNNDLASQFYYDAVTICETNNLEYLASIYHTLGFLFFSADNYKQANDYFSKAYQGALKTNDLSLQKRSLINLGSVNSSIEKFGKAEQYMQASLDLDVRRELDYTTYASLGYLYVKQKQYKKAMPYLEKSIEQHPDNPDSEINLYLYLHGKTMSQDKTDITTILERTKTAINTITNQRQKSLLLRNLADYYKFIGDYKQALKYRDEYVVVFEDIKEKQRDDIVLNLETKYQTEKKDAQLKVLALETEKAEQQKRLYSLFAFGGLITALLIGFFLYKNQKQKVLLAKQKVMLETTVDEKNVLLKEVHHRVKNSFQIVSSLLYLQSESVEDKEAKIAIKEAENRVRSMVLIHQRLYNKDELIGINTKNYFSDLVREVFESHQFKSEPIKYVLNIEELVIDIETITPLGLIVNELIVNTLKHAFKDVNADSKLLVEFFKQNDNLILKVIDNGRGFEGEIKSTSFGITLMKALSKKLKATLNYNSQLNNGTEAVLTITKFKVLS